MMATAQQQQLQNRFFQPQTRPYVTLNLSMSLYSPAEHATSICKTYEGSMDSLQDVLRGETLQCRCCCCLRLSGRPPVDTSRWGTTTTPPLEHILRFAHPLAVSYSTWICHIPAFLNPSHTAPTPAQLAAASFVIQFSLSEIHRRHCHRNTISCTHTYTLSALLRWFP